LFVKDNFLGQKVYVHFSGEERPMNDYSIALFLHVVGALGFFVSLGLEWTSLRQLRRATSNEQIREWLRFSTGVGRVGMASMITIVASGFYMMATAWGGVAWIIVALGTLILLALFAVALTGPRMADIRQAVTEENGLVSPDLHHLLRHPRLWVSMQTRVALALGIVFLMTVKPDLIGALLTIGVTTILGLASSMLIQGRERVQEEAAT
jgi:hypothetical protein